MSLRFGNNITEKCTFHKSKYPFDINRVHIEKIVVFNKFSCSENGLKYITEMRCDNNIIPLCMKLPPMSRFVKRFGKNKCMSFFIDDKQ